MCDHLASHTLHMRQTSSFLLSLSRVQPFAIPCTIACQAPQSMGFSRQKYWSGLPFPSPGDLPNPGIKPRSPALQEDSSSPGKPSFFLETTLECQCMQRKINFINSVHSIQHGTAQERRGERQVKLKKKIKCQRMACLNHPHPAPQMV